MPSKIIFTPSEALLKALTNHAQQDERPLHVVARRALEQFYGLAKSPSTVVREPVEDPLKGVIGAVPAATDTVVEAKDIPEDFVKAFSTLTVAERIKEWALVVAEGNAWRYEK